MNAGAVHMEVHPPTSVTHAIAAYLTRPEFPHTVDTADELDRQKRPPNLLAVRSNYVDIYELHDNGSGFRLELVVTQMMNGIVESLSILQNRREKGKDGQDALLFTFRDAKAVVMTWDKSNLELVPTSLHYFESDVSLKSGRTCFPTGPFGRTDPSGRCAAVIMFRHQVALLPATESSEVDKLGLEEDETQDPGTANFAAAVGNSYIDNLSKIGIKDIRDAVFLHGTSEPTLLCLHETDSTWAGSLREKKDTCCLSALSINLNDKRHPKIWEVQELPSDAFRMFAVPCGGALVLTPSLILFYNQGTRTGVVLHSSAIAAEKDFPPMVFDLTQEGPSVTGSNYAREYGTMMSPKCAPAALSFCNTSYANWDLDCTNSYIAWMTDRQGILSLKNGQLLEIQVLDKQGSKQLGLQKIAIGPEPSCVARVDSSHAFVGSIGGDSLLLKFIQKDEEEIKQDEKRRKLAEKEGNEDEELLDELEAQKLYSMGDDDVSFTLSAKVLDSISSLGAMKNIFPLLQTKDSSAQKYVVASGTGMNGSLTTMQSTLSPELIAEVPLPNVRRTWAIGSTAMDQEQDLNRYLLISFEEETKVLSAGESLKDITNEVNFATDVATIEAATIGKYEVQITTKGMRLLTNGRTVNEILLKNINKEAEDFQICSASFHESLILIQSTNGVATLLEMKNEKFSILGNIPSAMTGQNNYITASSFYHDSRNNPLKLASGGATYICSCYSNGDFLIWKVCELQTADPKPVWKSSNLWNGAKCAQSSLNSHAGVSYNSNAQENFLIDIAIKSFTGTTVAPILVAVTAKGALYCYKMFLSESRSIDQMQLRRICLRAPSHICDPFQVGKYKRQIFSFENVGEHLPYSGFYIAGRIPGWIVVKRGFVVLHLETINSDSPSAWFTEFNNTNCPRGFITVEAKGCIKVGNFPPRQRLDCHWPRRKVLIKGIPIQSAFYPEANLIATLIEIPAKSLEFLPEEGESDPQAAYAYSLASEEFKAGPSAQSELRLFNPNTWMTAWHYNFLPSERGISIEVVHLKDVAIGATVPMIAVGTAFYAGEDYPCSGRVLLFEIRRAGESWDGRLVFTREFKGPVTGLSSVEGYLLLSTGNRLETCTLKSTELVQDGETKFSLQRSAFYEGPSLVTSLVVIKNFILIGDVMHSVSFLRYKDQGKQMLPLAKDFGDATVRACQFLVAGASLHILMADGEGNLHAFAFTPNDPKSWKGQKLAEWGSLHIGKGSSCMLRTKMKAFQIDETLRNQLDYSMKTLQQKQGVLCGTSYGGIHMIYPFTLEESKLCLELGRNFMRAMVSCMPHAGGLNPAAFRRRYQKSSLSMEGSRPFDPPVPLYEQSLLDGGLLVELLQQPTSVQARVAAMLGVERSRLLQLCDTIVTISF